MRLAAKSLRSAVKPRMTPEEHLTLSPWEKCWRYRRFPFKFVVQMALLAACTAQTLYYTEQVSTGESFALQSLTI